MKHKKHVLTLVASALTFVSAVGCGNGNNQEKSSTVKDTVAGAQAPTDTTDPAVVEKVDVAKYVGLWFEVASIPQSFQSFCQKTTAEYKVISATQISVDNKCFVGPAPFTISGKADVVDTTTNAILSVQFGSSSKKGDYRIVALAEDYSYALVTNKLRSSLFVLSRSKTLDEATYASLIKRASDIGVDVSKVKKTKQD